MPKLDLRDLDHQQDRAHAEDLDGQSELIADGSRGRGGLERSRGRLERLLQCLRWHGVVPLHPLRYCLLYLMQLQLELELLEHRRLLLLLLRRSLVPLQRLSLRLRLLPLLLKLHRRLLQEQKQSTTMLLLLLLKLLQLLLQLLLLPMSILVAQLMLQLTK